MAKTNFPSEKEINEIRELLSKGPAAKVLPKDASPIDKTKYIICQKIVGYKNEHKLTQRQLAEKIHENESLVSKVVHYNIEEFTVDRLMKFLNVLYPHIDIHIDVAYSNKDVQEWMKDDQFSPKERTKTEKRLQTKK